MKIQLVHETEYEFNSKVFFEPHYLRFKPRNSPQIKLENFKLEIYPVPTGISEHIDAENNLVHLCWFDGVFDQMKIKSEFLLESFGHNSVISKPTTSLFSITFLIIIPLYNARASAPGSPGVEDCT